MVWDTVHRLDESSGVFFCATPVRMVPMISQYEARVLRLISLSVLALASACSTQGVAPSAPAKVAVATEGSLGDDAARIALGQVGTPYRYGGASPDGFDCSGLVHYSYLRAGKSVPRTTGQLWNSSTPVKRSDIQAGDILFFNIDGKMSHVGMYIGDSRFVHAPSSGKTVSVESLTSDYYRRALIRAGRPQ